MQQHPEHDQTDAHGLTVAIIVQESRSRPPAGAGAPALAGERAALWLPHGAEEEGENAHCRTMKEVFRGDGSKAERELEITYTPVRIALAEAIAS
jgi:hypothetical protein